MKRARLAFLILALALVGVVLLGADRPRRGRRGTSSAAVSGGAPVTLLERIFAIVFTGPSYHHFGGGTPQTPVWISPQRCTDDASVCAWQAQDGAVVAAIDHDGGAAASIGAIQAAAQATGEEWILLDWQQPQTEPWNYDIAQLEANITGAALWAQSMGKQLCPLAHQEVVGGYYTRTQVPWLDGGPGDASSHEAIILDGITRRISRHLSMLADAGAADGAAPGVSSDCISLDYYDLKGFGQGTASFAQHEYSGEAAAWNEAHPSAASLPLYDTTGFAVQSDGLHFSQTGHRQAADALGRVWARAMADGDASPFYPTAVTVVDATTVDVDFLVPCRVHGDCQDDPPLSVDTVSRVPQETTGNVDTYGLHFWHSGALVQPGAVSSATPQACASPATTCTIRYIFASLPDFDAVSFADTACRVFSDGVCTLGPEGEGGGGSNVFARVNSGCNFAPDGGTCWEQPGANRFTVNSYDAGPVDSGPDAGFTASNTQFLAATSGNYVTVANQGGGSAQCIFAWGDLPAANLDTIVQPTSSQRGFLGNIGGAWGCAISGTGPTYRVASGSYTTGNRYDVACCYSGGGAGPTGINIWVGGTLSNGSTNGAATALDSAEATNFPDNAATTDVDEVIIMPGKTTLTAQEILDLRCATKAATDTSPTSGECSSATTDISHICGLATGTRWYGFEGDATDRCGVLNGSAVGTPPYTSY